MANVTVDMGDLIRAVGAWKDLLNDGAAADPGEVNFSIREPDGTVTTYTYSDDPEVVRDADGVYHFDLDLDTAGHWYVRAWSTGAIQGATEYHIVARPHNAIAATP